MGFDLLSFSQEPDCSLTGICQIRFPVSSTCLHFLQSLLAHFIETVVVKLIGIVRLNSVPLFVFKIYYFEHLGSLCEVVAKSDKP